MCAVKSPSRCRHVTVFDGKFRHQVLDYSHFFDHLVDLVPAKYYLSHAHATATNIKYLKKHAREEAKRQRAEQAKKRKRERLDPEKAQTTLQLQVFTVYEGSLCWHAS
jgi:hypothetical protein